MRNSQLRARVIDKALRNKFKPYPTKDELRLLCEEEMFGSPDGERVSDSTIEKDMAYMKNKHDAPIRFSKRYNGYYYADPEFSLDFAPVTEDDIAAIKFAVKTLSQFKEIEMFKDFNHVIGKIVDRVAISNDLQDQAVQNFVQFETGVASIGNELLNPLLLAIKNKFVVYFEYQSFRSEDKKPRKVLPLLLKEYRNRWYLISYDLVKSAVITYALERMSNFESTTEQQKILIDFNAEKFFKYSIGITTASGFPEKIEFKVGNVSAKYLSSQPLHFSQKIVKEGKNKTFFEIEAYITEELIRELLAYGGELEVTAPQSLRDTMIKRIKAMVENYI